MTPASDRWLTTARRAVGVAFGVLVVGGIALWVVPGLLASEVAHTIGSTDHRSDVVGVVLQRVMSGVAGYVGVGAFGVVGLVILRGRPRHLVGWTLASFGLIGVAGGLLMAADAWGFASIEFDVVPLLAPLLSLGLLLFPNGRLPSPRWAWLLWVIGFGAFVEVAHVFVPELAGATALMLPLMFVPAVASLFFRRRSGPVERQQLKWIAFGATAFALEVLLATALTLMGPASQTGPNPWIGDFFFQTLLAWPAVAMGIAITRYRLYEIDRILSRTVTYSVVLLALGAAYAGLVLFIGVLLPAQDDLAVALSTLAVAFAFLPLARRVQAFVDRRFFRSRYDAASVVSSFAEELRHTIDARELVERAESLVGDTFKAEAVEVWLVDP